MMATETTTQLREELDQARNDFRRTADEIRRNLESSQLRLDADVRHNPLKSVALAGAVGFLLGRASRSTAVLIAMLAGAAVGYSIASKNSATAAPVGDVPVENDGTSRSHAG
jgi:hypothetical protein